MLKMSTFNQRETIKDYFYPDGRKMKLLLILAIIISFFDINIGVFLFIVWVILKCFFDLKLLGSTEEKIYDACVLHDLDFLKGRAINVMGVVEEELSLIEPIITTGIASEDCVKFGVSLSAANKSFIKEFFKNLIKTIFAIPIIIWKFLKSIFIAPTIIPEPIYYEGTDNKVRSSLRNVTIVSFTEKQVTAYCCNYDIALGIILEEYVREIFYRDIDSVNYGDESLYVWSPLKNAYYRTILNNFRFVVSSNQGIGARFETTTQEIENQITAAKALISSKKEEMA